MEMVSNRQGKGTKERHSKSSKKVEFSILNDFYKCFSDVSWSDVVDFLRVQECLEKVESDGDTFYSHQHTRQHVKINFEQHSW